MPEQVNAMCPFQACPSCGRAFQGRELPLRCPSCCLADLRPAVERPERVQPFANGTEYMEWLAQNCEHCRRGRPSAQDFDGILCGLERALGFACVDDGQVHEEVARRIGWDSARPLASSCTERLPTVVVRVMVGGVDDLAADISRYLNSTGLELLVTVVNTGLPDERMEALLRAHGAQGGQGVAVGYRGQIVACWSAEHATMDLDGVAGAVFQALASDYAPEPPVENDLTAARKLVADLLHVLSGVPVQVHPDWHACLCERCTFLRQQRRLQERANRFLGRSGGAEQPPSLGGQE